MQFKREVEFAGPLPCPADLIGFGQLGDAHAVNDSIGGRGSPCLASLAQKARLEQ